MTDKANTTYFKGDLAEYTGKAEEIYGGTFREVVILEGHLKGETRLVARDDDRKRAIALWRVATLLRSNQDRKLWSIAEAIDSQARRYAKEAGIEYDQVREEIENGSSVIAIAD